MSPGRLARGRSVERLSREEDFRRVYREGSRRATTVLVLHARVNTGGGVRLGFAVGRRFGSAVARNRLRRRLREAVRAVLPGGGASADVVVAPRPAAAAATFVQLKDAVRSALEECGVLGNSRGGLRR